MSLKLKPLQNLTKKSLSFLNRYLDPEYIPKYKASQYIRNAFTTFQPKTLVKRSLANINQRFTDYNTHGKRFVRYWAAGVLGMLLGAVTYYTEDIKKFFTVSLVERYQFMREDLKNSIEQAASKAIQQHVLKNGVILTELEILIYQLCTTLNIAHLTAESINKVLQMQGLNKDVNILVRQVLVYNVLREMAEEQLKKVVVLALRKQQTRQFLGEVIMNYLGGSDFDQLVRKQFKSLLLGNAFQQIMNNNAKSIIKNSLSDAQNKNFIFEQAKSFLYATNK